MAQVFDLARSTATTPVDLPLLDVDKAFLIAVAHFAGDETAVALDYRTSSSDPRVVASDVWTDPACSSWRVVAETFSAFVSLTGLRDLNARRRDAIVDRLHATLSLPPHHTATSTRLARQPGPLRESADVGS